jgi:HlyD family secretion protein
MNATQSASFWQKAWKPALALGLIGSTGLIAVAIGSVWSDLGSGPDNLVYYTVSRADLPIVVTERGNLESQIETKIRCEVENLDRSSGNNGTTIIFIVPNGSAAKKDDLLVELDSAAIRERLDQQVLDYERAKSQRIQAVAKYDNQITQNETAKAQAILKVELDKLQLEMYMDKENGTSKLDVETIERQIDDQRNLILESQMELELAKTEKAGMEALFKLGYRGRTELEKSRLDLLSREGKVTTGLNRLTNLLASRDQYEAYQFRMQQLTLEGEVATAKRSLSQVKTDNISLLAQAQAAKDEAQKSALKEKERLDKYEEQLVKCKIYAPHDGMVVYARERSRYSSGSEIAEGATVRQRQQLITLPDLSKMQVKTQIHEAVLNQIRSGLPASVRIDAFPNRAYNALVSDVAVVPASGNYTNVKTYECTVRILDDVEQLKPGMTAVVEMHVERIKDVVSVPVQAVAQIDQETWCYIDTGRGVERREIELGRTNDKFVHITKGLDPGERLVLNPMAILEEARSSNQISPEMGAPDSPEISAEVIAAEMKATPTGSRQGRFAGGQRSGRGRDGAAAGQARGAGQAGPRQAGPRQAGGRPAGGGRANAGRASGDGE